MNKNRNTLLTSSNGYRNEKFYKTEGKNTLINGVTDHLQQISSLVEPVLSGSSKF